jgi:uncharacterized protein (TIGR03083 family)
MEAEHALRLLRSDGEALAVAGEEAPNAPVAACPEWDLDALVRHVGRIYGWVSTIITQGEDKPVRETDIEGPPPTPSPPTAWYRKQHRRVIELLETIPPERTAWNFSSREHTVGFWVQRMAQETAVHRWDGQHAAGGSAEPLDESLAVEGIDEYLDVFVRRALGRRSTSDLHGSIHLHASGGAGEWWWDLSPESVEVRHEHAKADAAVRADASALLLWLWNRPLGDGPIEILGDHHVAEQFSRLHF